MRRARTWVWIMAILTRRGSPWCGNGTQINTITRPLRQRPVQEPMKPITHQLSIPSFRGNWCLKRRRRGISWRDKPPLSMPIRLWLGRISVSRMPTTLCRSCRISVSGTCLSPPFLPGFWLQSWSSISMKRMITWTRRAWLMMATICTMAQSIVFWSQKWQDLQMMAAFWDQVLTMLTNLTRYRECRQQALSNGSIVSPSGQISSLRLILSKMWVRDLTN